MCDTVVVTGEAALDGVTLFGKNSDREPNEAHRLEALSAGDHPSGSRVRMTYIEIPQVKHTHAVLLARPFNIWGAEMGINERGVAIGNEALFTRVPYGKDPGMTGMDLLRLGLERASTADQAVQVMTDLLQIHGQGGNCGFQHPMYYHNSYIIADPHAAWVLETAGPHWAARRLRGVYTISNGITIGAEWDLASPDLVSFAVKRGWCRGRDDFDFARCYSDTLYTRFSDCRHRCTRTTEKLSALRGKITPQSVMETLRDHGGHDPDWRPDRRLQGAEVCMHVGFGPIRINQTTGSMVAHLHPVTPTSFFTATAAPCTSVFKPVWFDSGLPEHGIPPTGEYDPQALFWRHERLHRETVRDYPRRMEAYRSERDVLEADLTHAALRLAASPVEERRQFSQASFDNVDQAEAQWLERIQRMPVARGPNKLYQLAWNGFNRQAQMPKY